jgi:hypothetical protein
MRNSGQWVWSVEWVLLLVWMVLHTFGLGIYIAHSTLDATAPYQVRQYFAEYPTNIRHSTGLSAELYRIWSFVGGNTVLALGHIKQDV